ncbi:MAG: XdhC family protein [Alphaproteobacteria bacterium]|nr:XdhC family protein [Alphaproteobacteria bacterium]
MDDANLGGRADDDKVLEQAAEWRAAGRGVALATVFETWGSSPRPVGSQLVVDASGAFLGSVSGGCIEGAVILEAQRAIAERKPRLLSFGVTNEMAWEVGLACGGKVQVYVEPVE